MKQGMNMRIFVFSALFLCFIFVMGCSKATKTTDIPQSEVELELHTIETSSTDADLEDTPKLADAGGLFEGW